MKIFIIVPVFNEGTRAVSTINEILKNTKNDLIVVDDGSTKKNYELLKNSFLKNKRIYLLKHIANLGKGAAMKTGVELAWKLGGDGVIFIDSDGQHNPNLLDKFEKCLEKNSLVFGYRKLNGEMPFIRKWGNIFAKFLVKILFNLRRQEFLCGYIGFKKSVYKKIKWNSARYGVETEIATKVGKNNLPFREIEIDTIYVDKYKGVNLLDAIKVLFKIPLWYFSN